MQHRADDRPGVDHGQAILGASLLHQVPGGQLGDRLRADVGSEALVVRVGPVVLVEHLGLGTLGEPDGGDGRGDDDSHDAVVQSGAEHPQRALARGDDQVVRVLGLLWRERGGDVEDVVTALDHVVPVLVAHQICLVDGEVRALADLRFDRRVHVALAAGIPDGGPDAVAAFDQSDDAPAGQVARAAGD
jgi:hypothetical protein